MEKKRKNTSWEYYWESLAGVASSDSRQEANENKENRMCWSDIAKSGLLGDEDEEAHKIREDIVFDKGANATRAGKWAKLLGIIRVNELESFSKIREVINNFLPGYYMPDDVLEGLACLDSEDAWRLRDTYGEIAPAGLLKGLAGVKSEKANAIREKYKKNPRLRWAYEKSLIGTEFEKKEEYEKS